MKYVVKWLYNGHWHYANYNVEMSAWLRYWSLQDAGCEPMIQIVES